MSWRDTLAQVLQGVTLPPQIPTNFQQPPSTLPLPPLGRFGMQAFNMAGLPQGVPRRMVTPAELVRRVPQVPGSGGGDRAEPYGTPGGGTIDDILSGGMIPPMTEDGVPIVAGSGSRIPDQIPDVPFTPDLPASPVGNYVPDEPFTYPTPLPPADSASAVPVPPPHIPPPFGNEQDIPYMPQPEPEAPWVQPVPGATTTEHSTILNPGTTVGDLMGGGAPNATVGDYMTDPFGSMADLINEWRDPVARAMQQELHLVDPIASPDPFENLDPFDLSRLTEEQRRRLRELGYVRDA